MPAEINASPKSTIKAYVVTPGLVARTDESLKKRLAGEIARKSNFQASEVVGAVRERLDRVRSQVRGLPPTYLAILRRGLSRKEAAFVVGVGPDLFDKMVIDGRLPKAARFSGRLVWDRVQIDRALDRLFGDDTGNQGEEEVADQWAEMD